MIKHLSLIMDGNRRWARSQGLKVFYGHRKGIDAIKIVCQTAKKHAIPIVSLYAFSMENLNRPAIERDYLFSLIIGEAATLAEELVAQDIQISFLGDSAFWPEHVKEAIAHLEKKTVHCSSLQLKLLFCYGGRHDLVAATQKIADKVLRGELSLDAINEDVIRNNLITADLPDPDIIVRTGGMKRLSNYLPFESIYSELYFIDTLWPDITELDIGAILENFHTRKRNFGI